VGVNAPRKSQGVSLVLKANNKRVFINHCKTDNIYSLYYYIEAKDLKEELRLCSAEGEKQAGNQNRQQSH